MALKAKNIIYVCPTKEWTIKERSALRDAVLANKKGHRSYLYCIKDSFLDEEAKLAQISRLYHRGRMPKRLFDWRKLFLSIKELTDFSVDLVHCYELEDAQFLAHYLRNLRFVPLILSYFGRGEGPPRWSLWWNWRVSRIDSFLVYSREMIYHLQHKYNLSSIKIENVGLGTAVRSNGQKDLSLILKIPKKSKTMGLYLPPDFHRLEIMGPVFHTIQLLNQNLHGEEPLFLLLIGHGPWKNSVIYSDIIRLMKDQHIEDFIRFVEIGETITWDDCWAGGIDIWPKLENSQDDLDLCIKALANNVPVVMPRSSMTMEILRQFIDVGETYKESDIRDFRAKCQKILENYSSYQQALKDNIAEVISTHAEDVFRDKLFERYELAWQKRERYFRHHY